MLCMLRKVYNIVIISAGRLMFLDTFYLFSGQKADKLTYFVNCYVNGLSGHCQHLVYFFFQNGEWKMRDFVIKEGNCPVKGCDECLLLAGHRRGGCGGNEHLLC